MSPPSLPLLLTLTLSFLTCGSGAAEPLRLITMGDSITRGLGAPLKPGETFAALVEKALVEKGIVLEMSNATVGGDAVNALKHLQAEVLDKKPHLVTLMFGTNDSYVGKGETDGRNTLAEYETALRAMISALTKAGVRAVLMTSPPWAEGAAPDGLNQSPNVRLLPYVEACRAVAKDTRTPLVDHHAHWSAAAKSGVNLKDWMGDFCHPNVRGHQEMASQILPVLMPLAEALAMTARP